MHVVEVRLGQMEIIAEQFAFTPFVRQKENRQFQHSIKLLGT